MKKSNSIYIIGLLLIVALIASVALVMRNQDTRRGAAFAGADVYLLDYSNPIEVMVEDEFEVDVIVDTTTVDENDDEAKVSQVRVVMCYGVGVELRDGSSVRNNVVANSTAGFGDVIAIEDDKCLNMTVLSSQPASELQSGAVRVAKVKFKAVAVASGTIRINKERSKVVGVNDGESDKDIEIGTVNGRSYVVTAGGGPEPTEPIAEPTEPIIEPTGENPILNFRMSYLGLRNNDAVCSQDWKVNVMVLGDGETRAYTDVVLVKTDDEATDGEVVFDGGLELVDFESTENLAVFIKGPMHLQVKYGVDDQEDFYAMAGGEISVTNDPDTSPFYDFSAYPVLAGDVTGAAVGIPDGRVDGRDFNYVKSKITVDKSLLSDGEMVSGDFDGDCWIGNVDLTLLMISLKDKQDQLY